MARLTISKAQYNLSVEFNQNVESNPNLTISKVSRNLRNTLSVQGATVAAANRRDDC